ncbi:hypothetical protein [Aphanothece minutissima]|uniref:Uncharacterized protein n=1 Tax=Aphanothece cf. minutissima CCALA 015 TaxID=2107695 RepID=A0ABX5FCD6_9CHRO|nr:hypothetical protein [Aphanothece minutissima]PSB39466.1 hypothetical protein C7B81_02155 [Aphanothece cf. minutissima CCALA 015]
MPTNRRTAHCITREGGVLVFRAPEALPCNTSDRVQIIDVFALQVASGSRRTLLACRVLETQPTLAAARTWSLAEAAQLIRHDPRPHRWVVLQLDRRAWGLFWAGGGLQHCRELLAAQDGPTASVFRRLIAAFWRCWAIRIPGFSRRSSR